MPRLSSLVSRSNRGRAANEPIGNCMPSLFDPIKLGAVTAQNRILMAPLTRARATMNHVPTPVMIEYYRQRAGAGLIISEATGISAQGLGWPYAPGIWNADQIEAWRSIVSAVHASGGLMFSRSSGTWGASCIRACPDAASHYRRRRPQCPAWRGHMKANTPTSRPRR